MPKASASRSPSSSPAEVVQEEDVKQRKKKNASAQAAFRQRRANYIATLESTVTSLESVVVQLQSSCRDEKTALDESKATHVRLQNEYREREEFWRRMWMSRPDTNDLPPLPQSLLGAFSSYPSPAQTPPTYSPAHSPTISSTEPSGASTSNGTASSQNNRGAQRYHPYSRPSSNVTWSATYTAVPPPSPSSTYGNYSTPDNTPDLNAVTSRHHETSSQQPPRMPYSFNDTPSPSPTSSTSSLPYTMAYPDPNNSPSHESRNAYTYPHSQGMPVTFHGGMGSIAVRGGPGSDALRQRLAGVKREYKAPERPLLSPLQTSPDIVRAYGEEHHSSSVAQSPEDGNLDQDPDSSPSSSPTTSPSYPKTSNSVAVIKAQSFGAMRKQRAPRRTGDHVAAKAAQDVLDARGLNPSLSSYGSSAYNGRARELVYDAGCS